MPIYEFFCQDCNTIFNFFAKSADTKKKPACPKCGRKPLERWMSLFSVSKGAKENDSGDDIPFDEGKMARETVYVIGAGFSKPRYRQVSS